MRQPAGPTRCCAQSNRGTKQERGRSATELQPFYYDLHIHTCLSPCGEDDMTPATVAGLSALAGLSSHITPMEEYSNDGE